MLFGWLWIARYRLGTTAIALLLHPLRDLQDMPQPLVIDDSALANLGQLIEKAKGQGNAFRSDFYAPAWIVIDVHVVASQAFRLRGVINQVEAFVVLQG